MKKEMIMKKLYFINAHIQEARRQKDWATVNAATKTYMQMVQYLKEAGE